MAARYSRRRYNPESHAPPQPRTLARGKLDGTSWADYTFPDTPARGGPAGHVVLEFVAPTEMVSVNASAKWHWSKRNHYQQLWRNAAYDAAETAADHLAPYRGHRIALTFALPVPDGRGRDAANYGAAAPTLKGALDGITEAGVLIPNDTQLWVANPDVVLWRSDGVLVRVKVETAGPPPDPAAW